jgi:hypothetical protein
MAIAKTGGGGFYQMKAHYFSQRIGRVLAASLFVISIGFVSSSAVQAQWWPNATGQRNRDYRREQEARRQRERERQRNEEWRRRNRNENDDWRYRNGGYGNGGYGNGGYGNGGYGNGGYGNSGYGNISQVAVNQGIQDGAYTGSRDAQRGQSYNPQRSHFYQNGHGDNGGYGNYGNSYQYQQAYRQGFVRGYDQGFRQYGGYNNRGRTTNNRFPFPW